MARGAGRVRFGLALIVLVLLSVVAWGARSAWRLRRALVDERRPSRAMVVTGIASGPVWTSDLGHTSAEQTKLGTIQVLHDDCFVSHVDGMRIEDSSTHVIYTLLDVDDVALGQAFLAIDHPGHVALSLDQAEPSSRPAIDVPPRQRGACEDARLPHESYHEVTHHVVSAGARVTVRACTNDEPNVLVPCGDGLDVVTTSSLVVIHRNMVRDSSAAIMLGAISALALLGLGSFVPVLRSSRKKGEGMTSWLVLLAFMLAAFGLAHARNAVRGVRSALRVARAKSVSFDALTPGPAKLTGIVVVIGDAVESPSGVACAYVDVVTLVHEEREKKLNVRSRANQTRTAPAMLRDAEGREITVDFAATEVAEGCTLFTRGVKALDAAQERWCSPIPPEATSVAFKQTIVERDALVTVVGQLREAGSVIDAAAAGYRDGAVVTRYEIDGDDGALLLVSHGPERTLWRWAVMPTIAFALLATLGFAYAALLGSIAILTW